MKYIIVENQQDARELINMYMNEDFPQMEFVGFAEHVNSAEELIRKAKPDLLLLDINLGALSAFDLLDRMQFGINGDAPLVLFITAYCDSETMLRAFEYFPLRYIIKPIDRKKLQISVDQAIHQYNLRPRNVNHKIPLRIFQINKLRIPKIKGEVELLDFEQILFLQSANEGQTTRICCMPGLKTINATKHLGYFKEVLAEYKQFFTISQSQIVNLNYLKSYQHQTKNLFLHGYPEPIIASRRGGEELRRWLCGE